MTSPLHGLGAQSVLAEADVARRFGINPSTWRRMMKAGETPSPIRLSKRRRGYLVSDLDAWWSGKLTERSTQPAPAAETTNQGRS